MLLVVKQFVVKAHINLIIIHVVSVGPRMVNILFLVILVD